VTQKKSTLLNTLKVSFWTLLSRIAGLIRDIATTSLLGASFLHDVFVVALKIPNVFRRLFAEGAFSQAFIPIYSHLNSLDDKDEARAFIDHIFGLMLVVLFLVTTIGLLFSPAIAYVFAPGFYLDPNKNSLTVQLIQIMLPYLGLISLVAFAAGIQNTHQKFSLPAATPLVFNITLIVAATMIAPRYEVGVFTLAWGVIVAGLLQIIIQIAPLRAIKRLPVPRLKFSNPRIKEFFILIGPAILAGGIAQLNLLIDTIFASLLKTGSPTWLYVSDRLLQFPLGVFAIALGTVLLPTLSRLFSSNLIEDFKSELDKGIVLTFLIAFPSACGLVIFGEQIIEALFLRGAFTTSDVKMSYLSLVAFINIGLNYLLAFYFAMGHIGLALASSISAFLTFGILFLNLCNLKFLHLNSIFNTSLLKIILATSGLGIFLYLTSNYLIFYLQSLPLLMIVAIVIALSVIVYFYIAKLLGLNLGLFR
jgi:putative peptidoglycan lipid II flippase